MTKDKEKVDERVESYDIMNLVWAIHSRIKDEFEQFESMNKDDVAHILSWSEGLVLGALPRFPNKADVNKVANMIEEFK